MPATCLFRVVNEIHSAATKKNKEWQEKLPIVVFKAEEIMYSKANSEAEYVDLKTLWERLNDAINIIVRRDESTESGDFLQPCIEAALELGCPRSKASRSQRHNNPRSYLSLNTQEATETTLSSKIPKNKMVYEGPACLRPPQSRNPGPSTSQFTGNCLSQGTTPVAVNPARIGAESGSSVFQDKPILCQQLNSLPVSCSEVPRLSEKCTFPQHGKQSFPVEAHPSMNSGHMYPLYYFNNQQATKPGFSLPCAQDWNRNASTVGMPAAKPVMGPQKGLVLNLLCHKNSQESPKIKTSMSSHFGGTSKNAGDIGYDLSLRLGPSPALCLSMESYKNLEELGSSSSHDRSRCWDLSPSNARTSHFDCVPVPPRGDKEFCFFPPATTNDSLEPFTRWSPQGEDFQSESLARKRKATVGNSSEDEQLHWQQLRPSANPFFRREQSS
ncbi:hypothetical protein ACLOJK_040311 [Asimina triloba]